jgi:hypothetical protein
MKDHFIAPSSEARDYFIVAVIADVIVISTIR